MSRQEREWRSFFERVFHYSRYLDLYGGICYLNNKMQAEFAVGCLGHSPCALSVGNEIFAIHPPDIFSAFRSRSEPDIVQADKIHLDAINKSDNVTQQKLQTSIACGSQRFHMLRASFTSFIAISSLNDGVLIGQKVSYGVFLFYSHKADSINRAFALIDQYCESLRIE